VIARWLGLTPLGMRVLLIIWMPVLSMLLMMAGIPALPAIVLVLVSGYPLMPAHPKKFTIGE